MLSGSIHTPLTLWSFALSTTNVYLSNSQDDILRRNNTLWYLINKAVASSPVVVWSWAAGWQRAVFRLKQQWICKGLDSRPGFGLLGCLSSAFGPCERFLSLPDFLENPEIYCFLKVCYFYKAVLLSCPPPWSHFWLKRNHSLTFTKWTRGLNIVATSDPLLFAKFLASSGCVWVFTLGVCVCVCVDSNSVNFIIWFSPLIYALV